MSLTAPATYEKFNVKYYNFYSQVYVPGINVKQLIMENMTKER